MKIVVSLKVVPDYEQVRMAPGATTLDVSSVPRVPYTFDELALEAALRLKDADSSLELVVVSLTADASKSRDVVKKALAMGADKAILVEDAALADADSLAQAQVLEAVTNKLGDVGVLTFGIPGIQGEAFSSGAEVAGLLGWPLVSYVSEYKLSGTQAEAVRHVEKGKQTVEVPTPAVITVGKFQWDPRLPTFKGIMGAKNKPMDTWSLADLGVALDGHAEVKTAALAAPAARGAGRRIEGEAADTAKEAIAALKGRQFI
ncbi:MAG: electron transfer flavoprotein subunit beta/FixA family protein [Candidatus Sericytochromatia bacterium]|nr:electron transfer flavoprotein subunit beta/FixA family protein [Candidatus Sericytochromatia bacterium]